MLDNNVMVVVFLPSSFSSSSSSSTSSSSSSPPLNSNWSRGEVGKPLLLFRFYHNAGPLRTGCRIKIA